MLKTNTLLTAVCAILLGLLTWLGHAIWDDVATIKSNMVTSATQMQTVQQTVADHETRIRQTEHDVTILQQEHREERPSARSPKMIDNNQP